MIKKDNEHSITLINNHEVQNYIKFIKEKINPNSKNLGLYKNEKII